MTLIIINRQFYLIKKQYKLNIMAKKKLITLAKEIGFNTEYEYFEYLIEIYIKGNRHSAKYLFTEMGKEDQKQVLRYIKEVIGISDEVYDFYFDLI